MLTIPLTLLCGITLLVIVGVLLLYNRRYRSFLPYLVSLLFLFVLAKFSVRSYLYPPQRIFGNQQFHVLEHQGFRFSGGRAITLASASRPGDALFNQYKGDLQIRKNGDRYTLEANRFPMPVYVADAKGTNIREMDFSLAIAPGEYNAESGFGLRWKNEQLQCAIKAYGGRRHYIFTYSNDSVMVKDTSAFGQPIRYALSLMALMRQTGVPLSEGMEERCAALLLARKKIHGSPSADNNEPLLLFPTNNQLFSDARLLDNQQNPISAAASGSYELGANQLFYIGFEQKAANNTSDAVMFLQQGGGGTELKFLMPDRYALPASGGGADSVLEKNHVLFITSGSKQIIEHNLGAGYLLPWFSDDSTHRLHAFAYFNYTPGRATDSLLFQVADDRQPGRNAFTVSGNQSFSLATEDPNVNWVFRFTNLHANNYIQSKTIDWVLAGYVLGALVLLLLVKRQNQLTALFRRQETPHLIPRLEWVVYMAILPFLVLRLLILWRIGTFPPLEGISYLQLNDYLNKENFLQLIAYGLFPFFVMRLIVLLAQQFRLYNEYGKDKHTFAQPLKQLAAAIRSTLLLVFVAVVASVGYTLLKLNAKYAGFLLLVYVVAIGVSLLSVARFGRFKLRKYNDASLPKRLRAYMQGRGVKLVLKLLASCLVVFILGGVTGFVIFKLAGRLGSLQRVLNVLLPVCGFLFLYWRFLPGQHQYYKLFRQHFWLRLLSAVFVSGILLLTDSGFSIIFIFFTCILFAAELFYYFFNLSVGHKKVAWLGAAALLALLLSFSYIITYSYKLTGVREAVNKILGENNNIKYRALVQTDQEDKLAASLYFKEEAFTRLQNAASNKWFINHYLTQPHRGYLSLQPHMDFGVSYPVQTMDLLMLRYVVAEHGEFLVVLLLALLLTISFSAGLGFRYADGVANSNQFLSFSTALLVFIIGFMVWLASTNRFIFFGQDFPLLSVQAKITTLLFFLFLVLMMANNKEGKLKRGFETAGNIAVHLFLLVTVFFFFFMNKRKANSDYNVATAVQQLQEKCQQLNVSFLNYQEEQRENRRLPAGFKNILSKYQQSDDWQSVKAQLEEEKDSIPFAYSVINRFLQPNTDKLNPDQLMHIVRNNNGLYELAVNRQYFRVQTPVSEQQGWRGSLVAAYSRPSVSVLHGRRELTMSDTLAVSTALPGVTGAGLVYLPPGYLPDAQESLLLYDGGGLPAGAVMMLGDAGNQQTLAANGAYRIGLTDRLGIARSKGATPEEYFIREGQSQYLARNIWLNGGYRLFYPFEDRFIWPYNMGNAVAQSFKNQPQRRNENFYTSLDYSLHADNENALSYYENAMKRNDSVISRSRRQIVTVAVMNGDGFVTDMQELDFNRKAQEPFNPNSSSDHFRFMRKMYSQRNASAERKVLGHQALLNMYNPGSTMKPIIYGAVTSGSKLDWESLTFENVNKFRYTEVDEKKNRVKYFAGRKMSHGFEHDVSGGEVGPAEYLAQSKNMYHSMMVYLGSFTERELDGIATNRIITEPLAQEKNFENFPQFSYGGQRRIFNPDQLPKDETGKYYFGNSRAVVAQKLSTNFGLAVSQEDFYGDSILFKNMGDKERSALRMNTQYAQYALPEKSGFLQHMRRVAVFGDRNGLTNPTVGAVVVQISPVKMAEMGVRLFTANRDVRIRMQAGDTSHYYKPFVTGRTWGGLDDLIGTWQKTLYKGMSMAPVSGTARGLLDLGYIEEKGLYAYCKTGTADVDDVKLRHKTLLVILSKTKLHDENEKVTAAMLRKNKVMSFYFSFFNHAGSDWQAADKDLIKNIIRNTLESRSYRLYNP